MYCVWCINSKHFPRTWWFSLSRWSSIRYCVTSRIFHNRVPLKRYTYTPSHLLFSCKISKSVTNRYIIILYTTHHLVIYNFDIYFVYWWRAYYWCTTTKYVYENEKLHAQKNSMSNKTLQNVCIWKKKMYYVKCIYLLKQNMPCAIDSRLTKLCYEYLNTKTLIIESLLYECT